MKTSRIAKMTAGTFAAAVASFALAGPAQAQLPPEPPQGGETPAVVTVPAPAESGWDFGQVAAGAAGGVVLVGAAVALSGTRRHHGRMAHA